MHLRKLPIIKAWFSFPEIKSIRNPRFYLKTHFDLKMKTIPPVHSHFYKPYTVSLAEIYCFWKTVVQFVFTSF